MEQIIKLAEQQLFIEQGVLDTLKVDKEFSLNEALRLQSEIPVQEAKVQSLDKNLSELYSRYGYPGSKSGCASVSAAVAPKKAKYSVTFEDLQTLVTKFSKMGRRPFIKSILAEYDVLSISELNEGDIQRVYDQIKEEDN